MMLHLIYTETKLFLSKKNYSSWRQIQDEYEAYKTSLGPWDEEEVVEYLEEEYSKLHPPASAQVISLLKGQEDTVALTFRANN